MQAREERTVEAFVSMATALATGYDVVDLVNRLTSVCADVLDIAAAGLLLADPAGVLHVLAASSEDTRHLETFQLQRQEGPCLECFATGEPVHAFDLRADVGRWPLFATAALGAGFRSVQALPLRLQGAVLGALGLFGSEPGRLGEDDLRLSQALADVASVSLVHDRAAADHELVVGQLQQALSSRVVIEQAKGVLAQQGRLPMEEAFAALRTYSRDRNLKLGETAQAIVARTLPAAQVLADVAGRSHRGS